MSVKSNGDSNNQNITVSGSVKYLTGTQWVNSGGGSSSHYFRLPGDSTDNTLGLPIYYVSKTPLVTPFTANPIVTATISGGSALGLIVRVTNITTSRFKIYVYNTGSSAITLSNDVTVNWIATESSLNKQDQNPSILIGDLP